MKTRPNDLEKAECSQITLPKVRPQFSCQKNGPFAAVARKGQERASFRNTQSLLISSIQSAAISVFQLKATEFEKKRQKIGEFENRVASTNE